MKSASGSEEVTYRDRLGTTDTKGRRLWIYPHKPKGAIYNARTVVSWLQMTMFFGLPWLTMEGKQAFQIDFVHQYLYFFGHIFWPQDLQFLVLMAIAFFLSIIFVTSVWSRVFCGWLCPQTVFMEMVFRKIEYLIDGPASAQRKLREGPWTVVKIFKCTLKQSLFLGISLAIAATFLMYIIGTKEMLDALWFAPRTHANTLIFLLAMGVVVWGVFAWFREQACIIVCPYGRLQSVLQDAHSVTISYDSIRGEPRAKGLRRDSSAGDCIDCHLCVKVCPTGIDIRNGMQMECVNCGACIDACNSVMTKVSKPKGLIRYASETMIESRSAFVFTSRNVIYALLLTGICSIFSYKLYHRPVAHSIITRMPGSICQNTGDGYSNIYTYQMLNKTFSQHTLSLKLMTDNGILQSSSSEIVIDSGESRKGSFLIILNEKAIHQIHKIPVQVGIYEKNNLIQIIETTFLGPDKSG